MEAIEFAYAEYAVSPIKTHMLTARHVLDGAQRSDAVLDFCPTLGREIDLDAPLGCVEAVGMVSGTTVYVPAELVFLPCPPEVSGACHFGSNSNGLASGNTLLEASVHGLIEVIERDIRSFQSVRDDSDLVQLDSLPDNLQSVLKSMKSNGLSLFVRHMENSFGLPYFMAVLIEEGAQNPIYISGGYGCHVSKEIAVTRAVCEAAQSRLSFIHGGRDDLTTRYERFEENTQQERAEYWHKLRVQVASAKSEISFNDIPDLSQSAVDVPSAFETLISSLKKIGINEVYCVAYAPPDDPLQVVRILVPKMEFFNESTARVGARLRDHVQSM